MKLKISKQSILALFFIFLMVGSSIAYGILQAFRPLKTKKVELPKSNIIDYELTPEQKNYLLADGKTIIEYSYNLSCVECLNQKALLEGLTNQFSDQLFLQEIVASDSSLTITSRYGQEDVENITQESIIDVLCELMINPPLGCIRRGI